MRTLNALVMILTLLASSPNAKSADLSKVDCLKTTIKHRLTDALSFRGENKSLKTAFAVSAVAHVAAGAVIAQQSAAKQQQEVDQSPFKKLRTDSDQESAPLPKVAPEELKKIARQGLKDWSEHRNVSSNLGSFIIAAERGGASDQRSYESLRQRVLEMAKSLKRPTTPEDLLEIRKYLTESVTGNYCRDEILMIDYFKKGCGNCQSHTKMMMALMSLKELGLDPRYQIGIQSFSDHVEPVFVDTKSGSILPMSGDHWTTTYRAPVYAAPLIFAAYLDGARESIPSEQLKRLELPRPRGSVLDTTQIPKLVRWISPALFSWNVVPHGPNALDGSPPKHASRTMGASASYQLSKGVSVWDQMRSSKEDEAWTLHSFKSENQEIIKQHFRSENLSREVIQSSGHSEPDWMEGNPKVAALILKLKNRGECQDFYECLKTASREFIASGLNSPEIAHLRSIWKDPANLERYSAKELSAMIDLFQEINALRDKDVDAMFLDIDASIREYVKSVQRDPIGLLQTIDKLPKEKKEKFFLLNRCLTYKNVSGLGLIPPWSNAFLSDFASGKIVVNPATLPEERIQVRLMTAKNSPVRIGMRTAASSDSSENLKITSNRRDAPSSTDQKISIQADTWMYLAMSLVTVDSLTGNENLTWKGDRSKDLDENTGLIHGQLDKQLASGWSKDIGSLFLNEPNLDLWKYQALGLAARKSAYNWVHFERERQPKSPLIVVDDPELEMFQPRGVIFVTSESDRKFIEGAARAVYGNRVKVE